MRARVCECVWPFAQSVRTCTHSVHVQCLCERACVSRCVLWFYEPARRLTDSATTVQRFVTGGHLIGHLSCRVGWPAEPGLQHCSIGRSGSFRIATTTIGIRRSHTHSIVRALRRRYKTIWHRPAAGHLSNGSCSSVTTQTHRNTHNREITIQRRRTIIAKLVIIAAAE